MAANPELSAGWLSSVTMSWLLPLLLKGYRSPLEAADIGGVMPCDAAVALTATFAAHWRAELALAPPLQPSIGRALRRTIGWTWLLAIAAFFVGAGLSFLPPLILQELVAHLQGTARLTTTRLWLDVAGIFVAPALATILTTYHNNVMARVGTSLRTALTGAIYAKALVLRPSAAWTAGEVITRSEWTSCGWRQRDGGRGCAAVGRGGGGGGGMCVCGCVRR